MTEEIPVADEPSRSLNRALRLCEHPEARRHIREAMQLERVPGEVREDV